MGYDSCPFFMMLTIESFVIDFKQLTCKEEKGMRDYGFTKSRNDPFFTMLTTKIFIRDFKQLTCKEEKGMRDYGFIKSRNGQSF